MKVGQLQSLRRIVAISLATTMLSLGIGSPRLEAMVVPSSQVAAGTAIDSSKDMATVQAALENKVVRQHLNDLGLTDAEIDQRLARLSPEQLHQVALQIDDQIAAADGGATIITVLVIAILAIVLIRLID